ncbi:efflux RND transporter permease subunit [Bacillus sp. V3B]|uniref:efflux RND transporter permease subunit n=1 Tax=Bacillus sp. V3B TaxID=2804915 RepID=UPI002108755B|nr:efflux RND transporter permease subunit [Bacillus sp. V3B]MCQ6277109.1 efflux RND transporter permease subunit [Bacillus sp. V3B]
MKIIETAVKRPVGVIMLFLGILALGFVSLSNLAIDLFPKIDLPIAVVSTSYDGAAPQEVEKLVSEPLEGSLSSIQGIDSIQSQSMANASLVVLMFQTGTDLDNALIEVRERVDQIKGFLPEGANDPSVLRFDPQQTPVMWISLAGDKDPVLLQKLAEDTVAPYLERTKGVASISIDGGKTREIQVELNQALLTQYGLTTTQVIQSLNAENNSGSAGTITKGSKELQVRINGDFESVEDIKNMSIKLQTGAEVRIKDIAKVKDTFKEVGSLSIVNNQPALVMSVMKQSDGNTVEVAEGVQEAMVELQEKLPEGVELTTVIDTSTFIKSSISSVTNNMILAAVLSIFVIFLFLRSTRSSIVIGLSIPISLISTYTMMYFSGETLNILSLGGLALGVGMMVDTSIIILENIVKYRKRGYSIKEASIQGTKELSGAVIASTATTLVVFLPIVFVEGLASDLFTPLALSVSFSLIASLVVSMTLVPMLTSKLLTKEKDFQEKKPSFFDRFLAAFESLYKKLLRYCLGHRKTTVGVVFVTLLVSLGLATQIGATFIPSSDQGQLSISVETPSGSSLQETERVVMEIEERLEPYKDRMATNYVSVGSGGFDPSAGGNTASFTIQLIPAADRNQATSELAKEISESVVDIAGAEIVVSEQSMDLGTGSPIQIQINGEDQEVLEELSQQVVWLISEVDGVQNPATSATETRPEIQVIVDREMASQYGLTYQQIMSEVQLGFNGQIATRYQEGGAEVDIKVTFPEDQRSTISDLETMLLSTPTGTSIPLSAVADLVQVQGPSVISRENQQRQMNVTSDVEGADILSVSQAIEASLAKMNFPEGYSYSMGGQSEDMMESFMDLGMALIFSIFLVYTVMAIQFESFLYPFVIMFSMPTAIIGVIVGLFVTGLPFSVPAFIGVIMLAGIVVNNAIVLVDYINILRGQGMDRNEAILQAGPSRLQPILMTTMTTTLGMIPLGLALGEGAEAQQPMAIVIIFGLTFSMFLTLLFVPVIYTYFDGLTNKVKSWFAR